MNFGEILNEMILDNKNGGKLFARRSCWDKAEYIMICDDFLHVREAFLVLCNDAGFVVPFVPSQGDLLGVDWCWI